MPYVAYLVAFSSITSLDDFGTYAIPHTRAKAGDVYSFIRHCLTRFKCKGFTRNLSIISLGMSRLEHSPRFHPFGCAPYPPLYAVLQLYNDLHKHNLSIRLGQSFIFRGSSLHPPNLIQDALREHPPFLIHDG